MQSHEIGLTFALAGQGLLMGMIALTDAWNGYTRLLGDIKASLGHDSLVFPDILPHTPPCA